MDKYDIEIIRLLVRDKGGVMERRSWKSICKALVVVQKPTHNKQSTPCSCCGGTGMSVIWKYCPQCGREV
jgi:hypothetical protein